MLPFIKRQIGTDNEAIIDESEEYLEIKNVIIQHDMKTTPNKMFIENNIPT